MTYHPQFYISLESPRQREGTASLFAEREGRSGDARVAGINDNSIVAVQEVTFASCGADGCEMRSSYWNMRLIQFHMSANQHCVGRMW